MAKYLTKTRREGGGSIVVNLPKTLVEAQRIKENQYIEILLQKCRKDGFGILKGLTQFTVKDELKTLE